MTSADILVTCFEFYFCEVNVTNDKNIKYNPGKKNNTHCLESQKSIFFLSHNKGPEIGPNKRVVGDREQATSIFVSASR